MFADQISDEMTNMKKEIASNTDPDWLKNFKEGKTSMEEALKEKFVDKLNQYYEDEGESTRYIKSDLSNLIFQFINGVKQ
jgi:hypothetical protein